jgi:hypothetical protein
LREEEDEEAGAGRKPPVEESGWILLRVLDVFSKSARISDLEASG